MFYKGQPVRCLKAYPGQFTVGKTYVVSQCPGVFRDQTDVEADDQGNDNGIRSDLFEPIFTPRHKLKVGDRVMVVACAYEASVEGLTGILESSPVSHTNQLYIRSDGEQGYMGWYLCKDTRVVKLIGETTVTKETITLGVKPSIADDLRLNPQARKVLQHLRSGNALTHLEAQAVYGIWSLSSRVSELKSVGYKVRSVLKNDAMGKRYASYSMGSEAARAA